MTRKKLIALLVAAVAFIALLAVLLRASHDTPTSTTSASGPSTAPSSASPTASSTSQPSPAAKPVESSGAASAHSATPAARSAPARPRIASADFVRADAFRRVVDDSVRECLPGESVVGLACDDPFCAAVIRVGPRPPAGESLHSLGDCAGWQRAYGGTTGAGYVAVPCPDGHEEILEIIHPEPDVWDGWHQLSEAEQTRMLRSLQDRAQQLVDEQACTR